MKHRRFYAMMLLAALPLAACSGNGASITSATLPHASVTETAILIKVPRLASSKRTPQFVSPSTKSLQITIDPGPSQQNFEADVATSSPSCASGSSALTCTIPLAIAAGSHSATIVAYDAAGGANGGGKVLSQTNGFAFTVKPSVANQIGIVLGGVPASVQIASAGEHNVLGSQAAGFAIIGQRPQQFVVNALDADGNVITGPGSPALTLASSNTTNVTVSQATNANTFEVQVVKPTTTPITLTASASSASATATLSIAEELWVTDADANVRTFVIGDGAPFERLSDDIPASAFPNGEPSGIAFDPSGNVWIGDLAPGTIEAFVPGTANPIPGDTIVDPANRGVFGMAVDASGTIWAAAENQNSVFAYKPGATTPLANDTISVPFAVDAKVDASGAIWVASPSTNSITAYKPGTILPIANETINGTNSGLSSPAGLAFDANGSLWVANFQGNSLTAYKPGTSVPITGDTITANGAFVNGVAVDEFGTIWTTDGAGVLAFTPGSSTPIPGDALGGFQDAFYLAFEP